MDKEIDEAGRRNVYVPSVAEIMGKKSPEKKFKAGAITATVWVNQGKDSEGKETSYRTISFGRNYLDNDGNWKTTSSLRPADIPKSVLVLNKAYEYLMLKDDSLSDE